MAGRIPPFTLEDFKLSPAKRAEITDGLTERQTFMVTQWMDLHDKLNVGDWTGFDQFMDKSKMTYDNPNRPDLGTFEEWSTSPMALFTTFPPSVYRTLKAWGKGDDEICVLNHHHGKHTGGPYMGVPPTGNQLDVLPIANVAFAAASVNIGSFASSKSDNIDTAISIDTTPPTVVNFTSSAANSTYGTGAVIPLTATLSEVVQAGGAISITLNTGAVVTLFAASQGTTLTGNYVVAPGDVTFDLDVISYGLTGNAVLDLAGNALASTAQPDVYGQLATLKNIAIDATIQISSGTGFSTNPNLVADKRTAVSSVPITFSTPVTGVKLSAFRLFYNGRSISLRGASVIGNGANYLLRIPPRLTAFKGIYTVQVVTTTGIHAISNGAAMTQTLQIYWGNGRSIGMTPTIKAKAFGKI